MRKIIVGIFICVLLLSGCGKEQIIIEDDSTSRQSQTDLISQENQDITQNEPDFTRQESSMNAEDLEDCVVSGLLCYKSNPEEYNMPSDCNISFGQVTESVNGDEKQITVNVTMNMTGQYTTECMDYSMAITPSIIFGDDATGVAFTMDDGHGSGNFSYGGNIVKGQESMGVSYECNYHNAESEWTEQEDGSFTKNITFDVEYKFTVPSDYAGLVMRIQPVTDYEEYLKDEEARYLQDGSTQETKFFKVV